METSIVNCPALVEKQEGASSYRWVILGLTTLSFILTFIARFAWPPLIPVVAPALGITMREAGAYMSAFYLGYVLTQIPAGLMADYFGVRLVLVFSLVVEGLATLGMGYITSYEQGLVLRVLTGLGAGADFSACTRALMVWFPAKERGRAFGVMLGAPSAGILLASILVPRLNALLGWQGVFRSLGLVITILGVAYFFLIRASGLPKQEEKIVAGFKLVLGNRDLILTALAGFCLMWVELGTATWTYAYVKHLGFSLSEAGTVMVFYGFGGLIAPILSGFLSDTLGRRKHLLMVTLAVIAPITLAFGCQVSIPMLSAMGLVFGFCSWLANPHLTVMISEFAGPRWAATANGASNFIFQLASMIGPMVMGWSIDVTGSFGSVWWIMAAGPLLGLLALIPVNPDNQRQ